MSALLDVFRHEFRRIFTVMPALLPRPRSRAITRSSQLVCGWDWYVHSPYDEIGATPTTV